jgi:hypothetical protein
MLGINSRRCTRRNHDRRVVPLQSPAGVWKPKDARSRLVAEPLPYGFGAESPKTRPIPDRIMMFLERIRHRTARRHTLPLNHRPTPIASPAGGCPDSTSMEIWRSRSASAVRAARIRPWSSEPRFVLPSSDVQILKRLTPERRASLL